MSIWISRPALWLGLTATLSACVVGGPEATRAISVSGGAVTVAGPEGYCIDRSASRDNADGTFVLLGTCAALSGRAGVAQPARPAVFTVSVLPGEVDGVVFTENLPDMSGFFRSSPGRAALSRSGEAESVEVDDILTEGGVLYLRLRDASALPGQSVEPEYWRAILALHGRIVTLSALGLSDRPLPADEKRRALRALVAKMRAANPVAEG